MIALDVMGVLYQRRGVRQRPIKNYNNMIREKIAEDMKKAMVAKDSVRVTVLRGLVAGFTNELIAKMKKPSDPVDDEIATAVIMRAVKQRKDSIDQFTTGGRPELAAAEQAELKIIEEYAPKFMSRDDIRPLAEKKKAELGVSDKSGTGKLVGALMKDLKGQADGADVKAVVEEILG